MAGYSFLCGLLVLCCAAPATAAQVKSGDGSFTVEMPAGWQANRPAKNEIVLRNGAATVTVTLADAPKDQDADDAVSAELARGCAPLAQLDYREVVLDGVLGKERAAACGVKGDNYRAIYAAESGRWYLRLALIEVTMPAHSHAVRKSGIDAIVNGLGIGEPWLSGNGTTRQNDRLSEACGYGAYPKDYCERQMAVARSFPESGGEPPGPETVSSDPVERSFRDPAHDFSISILPSWSDPKAQPVKGKTLASWNFTAPYGRGWSPDRIVTAIGGDLMRQHFLNTGAMHGARDKGGIVAAFYRKPTGKYSIGIGSYAAPGGYTVNLTVLPAAGKGPSPSPQ